MGPGVQNLVVALALAGAAVYLGRRAWRRVVAARQRYAEAYPHVFDGWDAK